MRNRVFSLLVAIFFICSVGLFAEGQKEADTSKIDYPVDTVKLITHSSPGGGSDLFLRQLIKFLEPQMGLNFVVENVKGGSSAKAMAMLANAPADGSIFYATTPTCLQVPMFGNTEYTIHDLEPMVNVFLDPMVLYVKSDSQFKELDSLIDYAEQNPGKSVWGGGTAAELGREILENLKSETGVDVRIVAFEGGGDLMMSVLNGTVDVGVGEPAELMSQIEAGQITLLASCTEERLENHPNVKTAKEQGIDLTISKFRGLTGPKGLPENVINAWEEAIPKVLADPEYRKAYSENSLVPAFMPQDEFEPYILQREENLRNYLTQMGVIK